VVARARPPGVHVVYGTPDLKIHAKLCMLVGANVVV
jgi:polyphosphate kinase